jgi:hypothetical protein
MNSFKKTLFAIIPVTLFFTQYTVDITKEIKHIPDKIEKTVGEIKGKAVEKATEIGATAAIATAKDNPYQAFLGVSNALNQYFFQSIKESLPAETREYIADICKKINNMKLNEADLHALLLTKIHADGQTFVVPNATVYGLSFMLPFIGGPIRTLMLCTFLSQAISKK